MLSLSLFVLTVELYGWLIRIKLDRLLAEHSLASKPVLENSNLYSSLWWFDLDCSLFVLSRRYMTILLASFHGMTFWELESVVRLLDSLDQGQMWELGGS